jgi:hypothetical protein
MVERFAAVAREVWDGVEGKLAAVGPAVGVKGR